MPTPVDWDQCYEFSRVLRAAPTATLDQYRSLCTNRHSSAMELDFFCVSETLRYMLFFKDSESLSREELESVKHPPQGSFAERLGDVNTELLNALIDAKMPNLWSHVIAEESPLKVKVCRSAIMHDTSR